MLETSGSSDHEILKEWADQHNYRRENPLSVQERIQFFIDSAQDRLRVALQQKDKKAQGEMRAMIWEAETALQHFGAGEIDRALIAYDNMHERRAKYNLPLQKRIEQSKIAQHSRRPQLPTRVVLCALGAL
jgi:hypothetical protein